MVVGKGVFKRKREKRDKEEHRNDVRNSKKQNCKERGYSNGLGSPIDGMSKRLFNKEVN